MRERQKSSIKILPLVVYWTASFIHNSRVCFNLPNNTKHASMLKRLVNQGKTQNKDNLHLVYSWSCWNSSGDNRFHTPVAFGLADALLDWPTVAISTLNKDLQSNVLFSLQSPNVEWTLWARKNAKTDQNWLPTTSFTWP